MSNNNNYMNSYPPQQQYPPQMMSVPYMPAPQPYMMQQPMMVPNWTMMPQQMQQPEIETPPIQPATPTPPPRKPGQANDLPSVDTNGYLTGDRKSLKDVIDHNIVVKGYRTMASKYKRRDNNTCTMYQFSYIKSRDENIDEAKNYIFMSGSVILSEQISKYAHLIPFYTRVQFVNNRYYTFGAADFEEDKKEEKKS